jgi:transposase InsO family protein
MVGSPDSFDNSVRIARDPAPGVYSIPTAAASTPRPEFADLADSYQVLLSLGRTGQCWDNALAESFFAALKGELIDTRPWPSRAAGRPHKQSLALVVDLVMPAASPTCPDRASSPALALLLG